VLHEIAGVSVICRIIQNVAEVVSQNSDDSAQIGQNVVVLRHQADQIESHIQKSCSDTDIPVSYALQSDLNGTAAGVMAGLELLKTGGDVLIVPGDVPLLSQTTLQKLLDFHKENANDLTLLSAQIDDPTGYGRVIIEESTSKRTVQAIVEEKDASEIQRSVKEINTGIYIVKQSVLSEFLPQINNQNVQQEYYFTDIVELTVQKGLQVGCMQVDRKKTVETEGFNDLVQLAKLREYQRDQINLLHRQNGVDILDNSSTWIDENVEIAGGSVILGGSIIKGPTQIGANCNIGPFSYIRPGCSIADHAKIGAYVEVKNIQLGEGSKIPHLSYAGDAEIGEQTNIGAGTIFANYDGVKKHRTKVGSNVKIGSKTVIVAPVEISDNVYTGANTLVRRNINENALAISQNQLIILSDWVTKHRK
jgi:bifunctional UDP-N-acetylglucosamine pyrophosphorylase/glucosamine-1-phosphate N-acetyltransferase